MPRFSDPGRRGSQTPGEPEYTKFKSRSRAAQWAPRVVLGTVLAVAVILIFGSGGFSSEALKIGPSKPVRHSRLLHTVLLPPSANLPKPKVSIAQAASNAAQELAGSGDNSAIAWEPLSGAWGKRDAPPRGVRGWESPWWWQAALDFRAMIRYLEQTRDPAPVYQKIIEQTFNLNVRKPGSNMPMNFGNEFMDDTLWWGIAWLEAARYELGVRHNTSLAGRYLSVAEWDATYAWRQPRPCGQQGIEWEKGFPPDTITNAEFVSLAGELAHTLEQRGPFQDRVAAKQWIARGWQIMFWLRYTHLINVHTGHVWNGYNSKCQKTGGALPYTVGETAEAFVQMGLGAGLPSFFKVAQRFLEYGFSPYSKMLYHGVLQEPCETEGGRCVGEKRLADSAAWKAMFVDAVADWQQATGSTLYDQFLTQQAYAVIDHAASNGNLLTSCQTPHDCQIGFYWAKPTPPGESTLPVGPGTQESGLASLTDALGAFTG